MIKLSLVHCEFCEETDCFSFNCPVCEAEDLVLDVSSDSNLNIVVCYDCGEEIELTHEVTDEDIDKLF